jgi:hypothetical protein
MAPYDHVVLFLFQPEPVVINDHMVPLWPARTLSSSVHLITIGGQKKWTRTFLITSNYKEDGNKLSLINRTLHYPENVITLRPLLPELNSVSTKHAFPKSGLRGMKGENPK